MVANKTAVTPVTVQAFLEDVDYPATKEELVAGAHTNGADALILLTLEQLPNEEFQSPAEVSQAVALLV